MTFFIQNFIRKTINYILILIRGETESIAIDFTKIEFTKSPSGRASIQITTFEQGYLFAPYAKSVVAKIGAEVRNEAYNIVGTEKLWIVEYNGHEFCLSWDGWYNELSLMTWNDSTVEQLQVIFKKIKTE